MTDPNPFAQPHTWDLVAPAYSELSVEHFERYARDAIAIADLKPGERVADIAAGPGSLALQAAEIVGRVDALDFSPIMLEHLRSRAAAKNIDNVEVHRGDGQELPFADASFDAGFSMFGLIFFPDRSAGFRELYRVLKPGGRCVVASWHPMDGFPLLAALFEALQAELPDLPPGDPETPLGDPPTIEEEMSAAGFEVTVHAVKHQLETSSTEEFWSAIRRTFAPIVVLENDMGSESFEPVAAGIQRRLIERCGNGPISMEMPAWLGEGRRPPQRQTV